MDHLTTEARNPASAHLDELTPAEIVRLMNAEDAKAVEAVASQADAIARAIDIVAERLKSGGRLVYVGAGTSGRLGVLDATECPPTFNTPPELVVGLIAGGPPALTRAVEGAEDHPEFGERDLRGIDFTTKDVLVGIATSGRTPYVLGAAAYARSLGAAVIGLACNAGSELEPLVDVMICPVVGPEVLSGSTRLKAGTATKLVLNMLTTGAMVRLGKTFGNLMVDLRATNTKLRARTNRIVRQITGLHEADAAELLGKAGGELKTALVMHADGTDAAAARERLVAAGGQVRQALAGMKQPAAVKTDTRLVLGVDGGGTSTVVLLADGETVLGRGEAGPSNIQAVGVDRALRALDEAVTRAFAAARRPVVRVGAASLGLAGADRPAEKAVLREWCQTRQVAERLETTNDGMLVLAAGTPDFWGVAVIAGTGSIAIGRAPDGRVVRCGGWGYVLGDEGSGYMLTVMALRAAACAADGRGEATTLLPRFLEAMRLSSADELVPAVYRGGWDRARLAGLAPVVFEAAAAGDVAARVVVADQADALAVAASAVARNLGFESDPVPIALAGGVLVGSETYRDQLVNAVTARGVTVGPLTTVNEPAQGAVRMARMPAG